MLLVWAGRVRSVQLQLTVDNLCSEDTLQILLNGESLEGERLERTHGMHHARMLGPPQRFSSGAFKVAAFAFLLSRDTELAARMQRLTKKGWVCRCRLYFLAPAYLRRSGPGHDPAHRPAEGSTEGRGECAGALPGGAAAGAGRWGART